jgi:hypothetical protein
MTTQGAYYDRFAWWLARERIGQGLREHYPVLPDLPAGLLVLVGKLATGDSPQQTPSTWLRKLDAVEGNQLLRGCRRRLRAKGHSLDRS